MQGGFQFRVRQLSLLLVLLLISFECLQVSRPRRYMEQAEGFLRTLKETLSIDVSIEADLYLLMSLEAIGAGALFALCYKPYYWLLFTRVLVGAAANLWNASQAALSDSSQSSAHAFEAAGDFRQESGLQLLVFKDLSLLLIFFQLGLASKEKPERWHQGPIYNKKLIAKHFPGTAAPMPQG